MIARVNQLDARELDSHVDRQLFRDLSHAWKYLAIAANHRPPSGEVNDAGAAGDEAPPAALPSTRWQLMVKYKPEIEALIEFLIFRFSVLADKPTPGMELQNLRYRNESSPLLARGQRVDASVYRLARWQKAAFAASIVGKWAWTRLQDYMRHNDWSGYRASDWRRRVFRVLALAERAWLTMSVLNFVVFLYDGKYRSVLERVLRVRLVYLRSRVARQVSFIYMNQQLVWEGLSRFLLFMLPLVNWPKLRRFFVNLFNWTRADEGGAGALSSCLICGAQPVTVPVLSNCGHLFCHTCLASTRAGDQGYRCPRCHTLITSSRRATADDFGLRPQG